MGKEAQVLKEKNLIKSLNPSACVPQVLCTCADRTHAGILLNACLACPLASILHTALDESSARFCAASVVIALEDLHKVYCSEVFISVPTIAFLNSDLIITILLTQFPFFLLSRMEFSTEVCPLMS